MIHPFILSGGAGSRLWPLSRETYPKQFLNLISEHSLLQETCIRVTDPEFAPPGFLSNQDHRFIVAEQAQAIGVQPDVIILEPVARNTAPAALIAALYTAQKDPEGLILLLPSDHSVKQDGKFRETVLSGVPAAKEGHIVTFGITPTAPETGYGYIEAEQGEETAKNVLRFIEKPTEQRAQKLLDKGSHYWNAGIFLYSAQTMIEAFKSLSPSAYNACTEALEKSSTDLDFLRLDETAYAKNESISVDYAIMEKFPSLKTIPMPVDWSDLGAWPAIWDVMQKDDHGNVGKGNFLFMETKNSYAHSEDGACMTMIGLENVFAVAMRDAIVIASKDHAQKVKDVVELLKGKNAREATEHSKIYRPWGWYEGITMSDRYQVKRIMVNPGAKLSLQSHIHRAEHWVVVSGTLEVTIEDETHLLTENQSTYIPLGKKHRLANPGKVAAYLIEVQSGSYLGEDDIIRYEDLYGRQKQS